MTSRTILAPILCALAGAVVAPAAATADATTPDVCDDPIDEPVAVGWRAAGADLARGACLQADVGLGLAGRALIDTPDFYGTLGGDASFLVRVVEGRQVEWGLGLRAVDVAFVQNAVWKLTDAGYGPVMAQVAYGDRSRLGGRALARALSARVAVPFTQSRLDGSSGALQLAALATWQARSRLRLHGRAMLLGWYGASVTGSSVRGAVALSTDVSWRALGWLTPTAGVDVQLGWYGAGLDHVAVRAGAHWRVKGPWRAQAAAGRPLAGAERQDVAITLGVRRDLD